MFFARRPAPDAIARFVTGSRDAPLSYASPGILERPGTRGRIDEAVAVVGHGAADLACARTALRTWKHFDLGWVELHPADAPIDEGMTVAVLIRHFGFWSLNGCRVVYHVGDDTRDRFGFAYGALTTHAEGGEELFEVFMDPATGDVMYRIRAVSWPQAGLARLGQPLVRGLQARFRRDSIAAMRRAISACRGPAAR
jgi:uncharacterized protein (UPF0548 family)